MSDSEKPDLSLVVNNEVCIIDSIEDKPLIPDGGYNFKLVYHETKYMFGTPRLVLHMAVIDIGELHGITLPCYRNVDSLKGKPRKKGGFAPTRGGYFMIEYCNLVLGFNSRRDRISLNPYYNQILYARTSTVKLNNRKKKLPEQLWYSKVDELIELRGD